MGKYINFNGSKTLDRTCKTCKYGQFNSGNNALSCSAWAECQPGTEITIFGNEMVNRECQLCPEGRYDTGVDVSSCANSWTECNPGKYLVSNGSNTFDRVCATCEFGKFSTVANSHECVAWIDNCSYYGVDSMEIQGTGSNNHVCKEKLCPPGQYGKTTTFSCVDIPIGSQQSCYSVDKFYRISRTWVSVGSTSYTGSGSGNIYADIDSAGTRGNNRDIMYIKGSYKTKFNFQDILSNSYTICSLTRYTGGNRRYILEGNSGSWWHGHNNGYTGSLYYNHYNHYRYHATYNGVNNYWGNNENWIAICATNKASDPYFINGIKITGNAGGTYRPNGVRVNKHSYDWQNSD
jgi:hypothetical protein